MVSLTGELPKVSPQIERPGARLPESHQSECFDNSSLATIRRSKPVAQGPDLSRISAIEVTRSHQKIVRGIADTGYDNFSTWIS
jgi:hypothetical protein